jgi:DNA invertase Pin-like site-specific DNA recombinase
MAVRAALYLRVSTDAQTTHSQYSQLWAAAARTGWTIVGVFEDQGISGTKGRDQRPAFDRLHRAITRREIDVVMAWSVDRLGRSLQDLVAFLGELRAVGVDLYLHQQGVDTTTPAGRALFQMMAVFAEFERAIIVERVRAGIARARAEGKHLGRPYVNAETEQAIRAALATGKGIRKVARETGVGTSVVQRVKSERPTGELQRPAYRDSRADRGGRDPGNETDDRPLRCGDAECPVDPTEIAGGGIDEQCRNRSPPQNGGLVHPLVSRAGSRRSVAGSSVGMSPCSRPGGAGPS